jgi:uncharacterized membrane protein
LSPAIAIFICLNGIGAGSALISGSDIDCIVNSAPEYVCLSSVNTNDAGFKKFGITIFIHKKTPN